MSEELRLLTVESHVTHGYVGNKAANFPLQCLGWDLDILNTVNYSNHTGYGTIEGSILKANDLKKTLEKLINVQYKGVITGYIPNNELIEEIYKFIQQTKSKNQNLIWLFDPVMGDEGVLYVNSNVVEINKRLFEKNKQVPLINIITPNYYELELIFDISLNNNVANIELILKKIHEIYKIDIVIITSILINNELVIVSSYSKESNYSVTKIEPIIKGYFTGVGDLFSALIFDKIFKNVYNGDENLVDQVIKVNNIMNKVLNLTNELKNNDDVELESFGKINNLGMKYHELRIIESREFLND